MEIRKTSPEEIEPIMAIYEYAKEYMRKNGNGNQWINGYPTREIIETDIRNGHSYVCTEGEKILAVFSFMNGPEPNYRTIYGGRWLNDDPYGVIHRLAAAPGVKNIGAICIGWCCDRCKNVRTDTHRDNIIMQKILARCGFRACGTIRVKNGSGRIAYQRIRE